MSEIRLLRPGGRGEEIGEGPLERPRQPRLLLREREQVALGRRMEAAQEREDLGADQPALRVRVGRVRAEREPELAAVRLRLLAPDRSKGRTTPSSRRILIPFVVPDETRR